VKATTKVRDVRWNTVADLPLFEFALADIVYGPDAKAEKAGE